MTATTTRRAVLVGTSEVTFTPYTIRKVGEVRTVVLDGVTQEVIYNPRRKLTYLSVNGVPGRIAAELVAGEQYDSFAKTKAAPKVETVVVAPEPATVIAALAKKAPAKKPAAAKKATAKA